ncbi:1-acyl-sn-glycerol-3-phosphate acyltransferase [Flavobacterium sp.]|uniref:1-acyl-sn-glycerol-3-phosphate acyltransferase n=1 Tax=Flavobacterium sp. TaxID=239 RepID=UPI0039E30328
MHHYFYAIHSFVNRNKALSVGIFAAVLLFFAFLASRITFSEDITKLIPVNDQSDATAKVLNQLNFADKITVTIHAQQDGGVDDLTQYAQTFLDSINQSCKPYIHSVQGRIDEENIQQTMDFVYQNLPLLLEEQDYRTIERKLSTDSIAATVETNYKSIVSPSGLVTKDFILQDPLGISFLALKKLQQLNIGDEFELENGFVVTKDRKKLLLFLTPELPSTETEKNTLFAQKLYSIQKNLNRQFKGKAEANYFGSALIAVANANQIKGDIILTTSIAMAALMLILILFYRKIFIPIIIFVPTVFGALFSIAFLYILKGTISAISLGIGSILIGITIDYSLHILTHYKHNSDVKTLYKDITMPLIMSSTTTAVAFLCLLFVNSEALQDLGIFAATITISSAIFSLLFVPHLYQPKQDNFAHKRNVIDRMADFSFHKNKILIGSCVAIIIVCFFTYNDVVFNNDLSQLNFVPKEIKAAEKELEESTNLASKSIYLAAYGNSIDAVLKNNNKLFAELCKDKQYGEILNFSSVGGIVISKEQQQQKIDRWKAFWTADKKAKLTSDLIAEGNKIGFKPTTYQKFYEHLNTNFQPIAYTDYAKLDALQLKEFVSEKNGFYTVSTLVKVDRDKRDAFVNTMKKQPDVVTIDRQQMNETFLGNLKDDFNRLINYSFIAVILILFFFFRRIELVLVAAVPIVITGVVTAGIMGIFGIELNVFSTIVCTLVFGHGVDFSIFMTSALQKQYTDGKNEIAIYRTSIILAVITTILGIGALIFAKHPALTSISSVSLIGVFAALIITFIFYPILFKMFISGRAKKGKAPFQFLTLGHSILSFAYFGFGGVFFSVMSFLLKILPFPSEATKMRWFRFHMSKLMKSVLYTNYFVKKTVLNPSNETFEKPAVIIANHTSFLDILAVGMLSPKTIYLVSDWVYQSPVFGGAVRWAGFYPVSEGIEGGVEHLRKKVEEGYSLIVFPEGTRSQTNEIKRFHKGAFYLAEHFNLDIIPVVIHGNSEALPKGDFIIYDGSITVNILPRIKPDDKRFGENYAERTKKMLAFFRAEFNQMRTAIEGPDYFKKTLVNSFDYKEREVVDAVKEDVKDKLQLYADLNQLIGEKAKILHIANDYGQLDVLLTLQQATRKVDSWMADDEKRAVARTNYMVQKRAIQYLDQLSEAAQKYDILLISGANENAELAAFSDRIILIDGKKKTFIEAGFEVEHEQPRMVILKRKN